MSNGDMAFIRLALFICTVSIGALIYLNLIVKPPVYKTNESSINWFFLALALFSAWGIYDL
ncbi:hypothetical protein N9H32_01910 [Gammaproteobacteria bacterium]|nr:hypothetical protein [Gammaproteobacteria bacterium]